MDEADFDDSDTWFHDGQDDEPKEQEVKLEVSVTILDSVRSKQQSSPITLTCID